LVFLDRTTECKSWRKRLDSGPLATASRKARKETLKIEGVLVCAGTGFDSRDPAGELAILSRVGIRQHLRRFDRFNWQIDRKRASDRIGNVRAVDGHTTLAGARSVHRNLPVRPTNHSRHQRQRIEQLLVWPPCPEFEEVTVTVAVTSATSSLMFSTAVSPARIVMALLVVLNP